MMAWIDRRRCRRDQDLFDLIPKFRRISIRNRAEYLFFRRYATWVVDPESNSGAGLTNFTLGTHLDLHLLFRHKTAPAMSITPMFWKSIMNIKPKLLLVWSLSTEFATLEFTTVSQLDLSRHYDVVYVYCTTNRLWKDCHQSEYYLIAVGSFLLFVRYRLGENALWPGPGWFHLYFYFITCSIYGIL